MKTETKERRGKAFSHRQQAGFLHTGRTLAPDCGRKRWTRYLLAAWIAGAGWTARAAPVDFNQQSVPPGVFSASYGEAELSAWTNTITAPLTSGSYSFYGWYDHLGARYAETNGAAQNPARVLVLENTTMSARYTNTTVDADGDGVQDWYELRHYGDTNQAASSDTDGDGYGLWEEWYRGYQARVAEPVVYRWRESASPTNLFAASETYVAGSETQWVTAVRYGVSGTNRFVYWTVNGVRVTDGLGRGMDPAVAALSATTRVYEAVAVFAGATNDTDADGAGDFYELNYYGDLSRLGTEDADGDGMDLRTEAEHDTHPALTDLVVRAETVWAASAGFDGVMATDRVCAIRTSPAGIVDTRAVYGAGTVVTAEVSETSGVYRFAYWSVNGAPQTNASGDVLNPVVLAVTDDVDVVAWFMTEGQDGDGDGVPDWYELRNYFTTTNDAAYDGDGDGYGLYEEWYRGYNPGAADPVLYRWRESASPTNVFAAQESYVHGSATQWETTNRYGVLADSRFAYWTMNGARAADGLGRGTDPAVVDLPGTTRVYDAVAYFVAATNDADSDAVWDWYELNHYGDLSRPGTEDADGDGLDLRNEAEHDTHPALTDLVVRAETVWAESGGFDGVLATDRVCAIRSDPAGFVASRTAYADGTVVTTEVDEVFGAYRFGYWSVNGAPQTNVAGEAVNPAAFAVTNDVDVVAWFVPETQDGDADGVPDWYELRNYFSTANGPGYDSDGDGYGLWEEWHRGYSALVADPVVYRCVESASPTNVFAARETYVAGSAAQWETTSRYGAMGDYRFAYWTANGTRAADSFGRGTDPAGVTLTATTRVYEATAVCVGATNDTDADGVLDWCELNHYGDLSRPGTEDADGDGLDLGMEAEHDTHPALTDLVVRAETVWAEGGSFDFRLREYYPNQEQVLMSGQMTNFFSLATTNASGLDFGDNSTPALGDWDGDGDLDLFVGASGGVVRVFENAGSPVVVNFIERTGNFAAMEHCWNGVLNPAPALGDWNNDGVADLAVGGDTGTIRIVSSTTNFASPQSPAVDYGLATSGTTARAGFGDVNDDGWLDLLVLDPDGWVGVYTNSGNASLPFSGTMSLTNLLGTAVPSGMAICGVDVNEDGLTDILVSDLSGRCWEFRNMGGGSYLLVSKVFGTTGEGYANRLAVAVGDVDGDGDADLIGGYDGGGLVYLRNPDERLVISPAMLTLLAGGSQSFAVQNTTNAVSWTLALNGSGGTVDPNTGFYTAGTNAPATDLIEAVDALGVRGQVYVNVIGADQVTQAGKAIVLSGRKSESDSLWTTTDYLADLGYNTLLYAGYSKTNVQYLSPDPNQDADGNGLLDDIDLENTFTNVAFTFTNWVGNTDRLFVYLVDHGGDSSSNGYFRLNASETLTAAQLDAWLDGLQDQNTNLEITVLIDCCNSGSFLDELAYTGTAKRIVMAACADDESTYFMAGGLVSFSDAFFCGVLLGLNVEDCFGLARDAMSAYQDAWLDDTKDGLYQAGIDGTVAAGGQIGASTVVGKDIPCIGSVCGNQSLSEATAAQLWARDVSSAYAVDRVWCLVIPPGHSPEPGDPVSDVPELDLTYNPATGRYEADYSGFSAQGTYKVVYYARDIWGSVSLPVQSYVMQNGYDERVLLVAGGVTNSANWQRINTIANLAYHTFRARWIAGDSIRYLSAQTGQDPDADGTNDVDALPTLAEVSQAITNWARNADKLTVYLVGDPTNGAFSLNATESLGATVLDGWLDEFQQSNADVTVVLEFKSAGAFLGSLIPPGSARRVNVAAAAATGLYCAGNGGTVSFSQYFLTSIFSGLSVGEAFGDARDAIGGSGGGSKKSDKQTPAMDDNADGTGNKKDGQVAETWYIGSAFMTGAETPVIGTVMPGTLLTDTNALTLWVADITSMAGISNVWSVITPPDYLGEGDLPQIDLAWNGDLRRYEAVYSNFTLPGSYMCTFHAGDTNGDVSSPVQSEVLRPDAYEPDDNKTQAVAFVVGDTQAHNVHKADDEDWVRFYALSNYVYEIETYQAGTNADTVLGVYYEMADGTLTNVAEEDSYWNGEGEGEYVRLEHPDTGFYYVRVKDAESNRWGAGSGYELTISIPAGGTEVLLVLGINGLTAGPLPAGIKARLDVGDELDFWGNTSVSFSRSGTHTVTLTGVPAGWDYVGYDASQVVSVPENGFGYVSFVLVPMIRMEGAVRDEWTGAQISGAALQWTATSGRIAGQTAATVWASEADGSLPTNVLLMTENWDLLISKAGYSNRVVGVGAAALSAGSVSNLGWVSLAPVDANTNGMADSWETALFGGMTNVNPLGDDDGDGLNNRQEYWVGTDPTNKDSALKMGKIEQPSGTNGLTVTWPVMNGRSYQVVATNALEAGDWPVEGGPWTAAAGQTNMTWTDTNAASGTKFYRMEVVVP